MAQTQVFVGLGGNVGDTVAILNSSLNELSQLPSVCGLSCSAFYQTSPVGPIPQNDFVNAVCTFKTNVSVHELHKELKRIEAKLGKTPKVKDAPRTIDLDLLFFGKERHQYEQLTVPHPKWEERLFVVKPLSDLVTELTIPGLNEERTINLKQMLETFPNIHNETVVFLTKPSNNMVKR